MHIFYTVTVVVSTYTHFCEYLCCYAMWCVFCKIKCLHKKKKTLAYLLSWKKVGGSNRPVSMEPNSIPNIVWQYTIWNKCYCWNNFVHVQKSLPKMSRNKFCLGPIPIKHVQNFVSDKVYYNVSDVLCRQLCSTNKCVCKYEHSFEHACIISCLLVCMKTNFQPTEKNIIICTNL